MEFKCWNEKGESVELSKEEKEAYIKHIKKNNPNQEIAYIEVSLDGEFVDLKYEVVPIPFERIRRITGYLVGDTKHWNDAKLSELRDRVKHN